MRPERILHIPGRIRNVLDHGGLPPTGLIDMLVNFMGFMPLGFLGARAWRTRPLHAVMLLVVCTSMTMELGQIAFADRTPSALDLILNLIGGMLGALLFSRIQPSDRTCPGSEPRVALYLHGSCLLVHIYSRVIKVWKAAVAVK